MESHVLQRQSNNKRGGEQSRRLATRQLPMQQYSRRVLQEMFKADQFENGKCFNLAKRVVFLGYVRKYNIRAEEEQLILAMLSYRFVQAILNLPKKAHNPGLKCRSPSKIDIVVSETFGLAVLLM